MRTVTAIAKALAYIIVWMSGTLLGGAIGAWWPVRNVQNSWTGDGIGMVLFGAIGLFGGAVLSFIVLFWFSQRGVVYEPRTPHA